MAFRIQPQDDEVTATPRRKLSNRDRLKVWESAGGICCICGTKIRNEPWIVEHIRPLAQGGADTLENMGPAHERCAKKKTRRDNADTAKAKRMKAKHIGAHKSKKPMPFGRNSPFKQKVGGGVVRRDDE